MDLKNKKIFRAKLDVDFYIIENRIVLSDEYKKQIRPKKLTGSRFGNIFEGKTSQIKIWMQIFNLYNEPFDEMYSEVGQEIEPKLREYYSEKLGIKFISYNPNDVKWDLFQNNKVFGGIPDGEPSKDGEVDYSNEKRMIEIKTSSIDSFVFKKEKGFFYLQKEDNFPIVKLQNAKYQSWFDENNNIIIPNNYIFQLSLYMYLRNINLGAFIVGFVPTYNYRFPKEFDVNNANIHIVNYNMNIKVFKDYIYHAKKWWDTYVESGISPELSSSDIDWIKEIYDND